MPEGPPQPLLIQDRYTWIFADGTVFSDAIVMERNAYQAMTPAQIKTMKQSRAQAWKQIVDISRSRVYTEPELKTMRREHRQALREQRDQAIFELVQVDAEIAAEV